MIMLAILLALATLQEPAGGAAEAPPNTTIHAYDVAGPNLPAIMDSIAARPRKAPTDGVSASSSEWDISVSFDQKFADGECVISSANARFSGSISLPRLANAEALPGDQKKVWDHYVANLKAHEVAKLRFVHDRIGEVEKAVMGSSCLTASNSASAAADRIGRELSDYARRIKKPAPTFRIPVRDVNDPRG